MRYAIYPRGEKEITQFLVVPEHLIKVVTPPEFSYLSVSEEVQQETHLIEDGEAVLRREV